MNYYQSYGYNDFIICLGYKGNLINEFFLKEKHKNYFKRTKIKLINTGKKSYTGERIKRIKKIYYWRFFFNLL